MLRVAARDLAGASLDEVVARDHRRRRRLLGGGGDARPRAPSTSRRSRWASWAGRELNYSSDVDLLFVHERSAPGATARPPSVAAGALLASAVRADRRRRGAARRHRAAAGRPRRRARRVARRHARLLRARVGHVGTPGDDQGPCRGGRPVARARVRRPASMPFVYPRASGARRDRRRPPHEGPPRGVHPPAGQGVHRGQARPRRHPRRGVRGAAAADRARAARPAPCAVPNTLSALQALAEEGYVADADATALADAYRFLRRLEHRLQIVRDLQTHDLPADPPRAHDDRALARAGRRRDAAGRVRPHDRARPLDPRAAVLPAAARGVRRSRAASTAAPTARRPQELLAGLGFAQPARSYEVLGAPGRPGDHGSARCLAHVFPVMTPAIALAADPDAALVRLERVAEAVGERHGPADALAADPGRGAAAGARRRVPARFATDLRWSRTPSGSARSPTASCTPTTRPPTWCGWSRATPSRELSPARDRRRDRRGGGPRAAGGRRRRWRPRCRSP